MFNYRLEKTVLSFLQLRKELEAEDYTKRIALNTELIDIISMALTEARLENNQVALFLLSEELSNTNKITSLDLVQHFQNHGIDPVEQSISDKALEMSAKYKFAQRPTIASPTYSNEIAKIAKIREEEAQLKAEKEQEEALKIAEEERLKNAAEEELAKELEHKAFLKAEAAKGGIFGKMKLSK